MKPGLIGIGITQSRSPDLHHRLGQLTDPDTRYDLFDVSGVSDFSLPAHLERLQREGYRGVNITCLFKEQALGLADHVGDSARRVGSTRAVAAANRLLTFNRTPNLPTDWTQWFISTPWTFLIAVSALLLIVGLFLEDIAAMLVLVLILPLFAGRVGVLLAFVPAIVTTRPHLPGFQAVARLIAFGPFRT